MDVPGTIGQQTLSGVAGTIQKNGNVKKALNNTLKYAVMPTSALSAGLGTLSFALPFFDKQNEFLDTLAAYCSKAAVFTTGIFGIIHNFSKKNFFATLGYSSDLVTATIATGKSLYPLRALGSALDQLPAMLKDTAYNPAIVKKYNSNNLSQGDFVNEFLDYKGFWDSAQKTLYSSGVIMKDVFRDIGKQFKKEGILSALKSIFYVAKENDPTKINSPATSSKNLLLSTLGLLGSVFTYGILKYEKFGSTLRDIFGLHADIAVWLSGQVENSKDYDLSGKFYTAGTGIDLISRWIPSLENLHLFALGADRIGGYYMVRGNYAQDYPNGNGHHAAEPRFEMAA